MSVNFIVLPKLKEIKRFFEKLTPSKTGCWQWNGALDKATGFTQFWFKGRVVGADRYAWGLFHGPIPCGKTLRRKSCCKLGTCVNPAHMEVG